MRSIAATDRARSASSRPTCAAAEEADEYAGPLRTGGPRRGPQLDRLVFAAAPLLVGHSMGGFVTPWLATTRSASRAPCSWMGPRLPAPADLDIDAALTAVIGPAMDRLAMRFASVEDYLGFWDAHPRSGRCCVVPGARRSGSTSPTTW